MFFTGVRLPSDVFMGLSVVDGGRLFVVADSETNTSVPSETDSSGKGVYNIYPARDNFFRLTRIEIKMFKKKFFNFSGFFRLATIFSDSRQIFRLLMYPYLY